MASAPRINEAIKSSRIIFIDENGTRHVDQVVPTVLRRIDRKLYDLVEVNSSHSPPICKLVSKTEAFRKQRAIDEAATKQRLKNREKEFRLGTSITEHDYQIRMHRIQETLEKSFRVRVVVEPKGVVNKSPIAREQLWKRVLDELVSKYGKTLNIICPPQIEMRSLAATVALTNWKPAPSPKSDE